MNHALSAILRGKWLVQEHYAVSHLPLVTGFLEGKISGQEFLKGSGPTELPFYLQKDGSRKEAFGYDEAGRFVFKSENCTPGSIAVVPFVGVLTKYNGDCGEPGMISKQNWIKTLTDQPNCIAYISLIDCPGGEADGTPQLVQTIIDLPLPTAAVISGGAYSGGAWIASGHDYVYFADEYCQFGSIGAYRTIFDPSGVYEKDGWKIITIYPEISKDKNGAYRKALKGDLKEVTEDIANLAETFVFKFAENRAGKLTSDEWNSGKEFNANDSIRIGLVDGIKPMLQVAEELRSTPKSTTKILTNNSTEMKFDAVSALANNANPTEDQLTLANADLTVAGITGITLVQESFITEAANVTAANKELTTQLEAANSSLETAQTLVKTQATEIAELKTKVEAFGANPGAQHTQKPGGDSHADQDSDSAAVISSLAHNKAAADALGL